MKEEYRKKETISFKELVKKNRFLLLVCGIAVQLERQSCVVIKR